MFYLNCAHQIFLSQCVGIVVYRGLYFGLYDSLKPVLLVGTLADSFFASFMLGWGITIGAGKDVNACIRLLVCCILFWHARLSDAT